MEIFLDGEVKVVEERSKLGDILGRELLKTVVAVITPSETEAEVTRQFRITTTAGEMIVELYTDALPFLFTSSAGKLSLSVSWVDRNGSAFGIFTSSVVPSRTAFSYERGDLLLGCGGYDPKRSVIFFSAKRHYADHGADEKGGIIGKVVSGIGVIERVKDGDHILSIEQILSRVDKTNSFTTSDPGTILKDGMHIITHLEAIINGYSDEEIDVGASYTAEHFLRSILDGRFKVARSSSTHIMDSRYRGSMIPLEDKKPRLEGAVTLRTAGKLEGSVFIYTRDIPATPSHTHVARIAHGIELAALANEGDLLSLRVTPKKFDLLGMGLKEARLVAESRGISFETDEDTGERVVVTQEPATTLEVLKSGRVSVETKASRDVVTIELFDEDAPDSCALFRKITGLRMHSVGVIPLHFIFDDVFLFNPAIGQGINIVPENTPNNGTEVPAFTLAITNDSRKAAGLVGVRGSSNMDFGPTSEPFNATNIIGRVVDTEKLEMLSEGDTVYIREVRE